MMKMANDLQDGSAYAALSEGLSNRRDDFAKLLGGDKVDLFIQIVLKAVTKNPELMAADRRSLLNSCLDCAADGLMPDGRDAVLCIYNTNTSKQGQPPNWVKLVQYQPMYGGIVRLIYESGECLSVDAACIYEKDSFHYRRGDDPKIEHEVYMGNRGAVIGVYAIVKLKNGEKKREVMTFEEIESVRKASKAATSGPWRDWYDQQAIKSVVKRIYKQLPKSERASRAIESDNVHYLSYEQGAQQAAALPQAAPLALPMSAAESDALALLTEQLKAINTDAEARDFYMRERDAFAAKSPAWEVLKSATVARRTEIAQARQAEEQSAAQANAAAGAAGNQTQE